VTQFAVKDIRPNPFRHVDRYPIKREKVDGLRESYRTTGFWDNVVARVTNGHPEIAYGHHRLVALKEEYGPDYQISLVVRDLSDETMIQIMARENMDEWGTSAAVEHETVRAVVEAYAEGQIELPRPRPKTPRLRYAPSFIVDPDVPLARAEHPYTAQSIADFLGWLKPDGEPQAKVHDALMALQFIEEGTLKESDFDGLGTKEAQAVVSQARQAKTAREAAARLARQEAERAEKEAKEAERRRAQAEAQAAKARDEEKKKAAEREARERAEEARRAEERRATAVRREQEERKRGRKEASTVGKAVSRGLREKRITYRQAPTVAAKVAEKREGAPPDIDTFARRLGTDVNKILDDRDPRSEKLDELIKFRDYLGVYVRDDLVKTLGVVAKRASDYADKLADTPKKKAGSRAELPVKAGG